MSSTKQSLNHTDLVKGMSVAGPTVAVTEGTWRYASNMRFYDGKVVQFPRLYEHTAILRKPFVFSNLYYPWRVLHLHVLPHGEGGTNSIIALTEAHVFRLTGDNIRAVPCSQSLGQSPVRWSTVACNEQLYFSRPGAGLFSTDGSVVTPLSKRVSVRHLDVFFGHLIAANGRVNNRQSPFLLAWSDLNNFGEFTPALHNEADHRMMTEHQRGSTPYAGVKGIGRLRDLLYVYTNDAIFAFEYVGLPMVLKEHHVVTDRGCGFDYGLVKTDKVHVFPSLADKTFYVFDGQGVIDIGKPINDYFFSIAKKYDDVWSFYDAEYHEACWVVRDVYGAWTTLVVFNLDLKAWWIASVPDISAFAKVNATPTVINDYDDVIDTLHTRINDEERPESLPKTLFGSYSGRILGEADSNVPTEDLLYAPPPILRTHHLTYGDAQKFKESDYLTLHATYEVGNGIEVSVDAKRNLAVDDSFTVVGDTWIKNVSDGHFSFPRVAGRAFAYNFRFLGAAGAYDYHYIRATVTMGWAVDEESEPPVDPSGEGKVIPPEGEWDGDRRMDGIFACQSWEQLEASGRSYKQETEVDEPEQIALRNAFTFTMTQSKPAKTHVAFAVKYAPGTFLRGLRTGNVILRNFPDIKQIVVQRYITSTTVLEEVTLSGDALATYLASNPLALTTLSSGQTLFYLRIPFAVPGMTYSLRITWVDGCKNLRHTGAKVTLDAVYSVETLLPYMIVWDSEESPAAVPMSLRGLLSASHETARTFLPKIHADPAAATALQMLENFFSGQSIDKTTLTELPQASVNLPYFVSSFMNAPTTWMELVPDGAKRFLQDVLTFYSDPNAAKAVPLSIDHAADGPFVYTNGYTPSTDFNLYPYDVFYNYVSFYLGSYLGTTPGASINPIVPTPYPDIMRRENAIFGSGEGVNSDLLAAAEKVQSISDLFEQVAGRWFFKYDAIAPPTYTGLVSYKSFYDHDVYNKAMEQDPGFYALCSPAWTWFSISSTSSLIYLKIRITYTYEETGR